MNNKYLWKTAVLLFLAVRLPAAEGEPARSLVEEIIAESVKTARFSKTNLAFSRAF